MYYPSSWATWQRNDFTGTSNWCRHTRHKGTCNWCKHTRNKANVFKIIYEKGIYEKVVYSIMHISRWNNLSKGAWALDWSVVPAKWNTHGQNQDKYDQLVTGICSSLQRLHARANVLLLVSAGTGGQPSTCFLSCHHFHMVMYKLYSCSNEVW